LTTRPEGTGSAMAATIGTVAVAALQLNASLDELATMTSGFVRPISWQSSGKSSSRPSPEYRVAITGESGRGPEKYKGEKCR
jgi:hypothetical protein